MDPISVTASAITLLAVGGKAAKVVKHLALLRTAPDVVLALNNELTDLRLVITAIEAVFKAQEASGTPSQGRRDHQTSAQASLVSSLKQVNEKALELEALYDKLCQKNWDPKSSSLGKIHRGVWLLEHRNIKRVQEDFRSLRLKLVAALGVLNSASLHRLEYGIQDLHLKLSDLQSTQQALHISQNDVLSQQQAILHEPITLLSAVQQRMEMKIDMMEASVAVMTACALPTSPIQSTSPSSSHTIRTAYVPSSSFRWRCSRSCVCVCHTSSSVKLPSFLKQFLGALFIGYSGIPRITPPCDVKACVERSSLSVTATYLFPSWLLARAMFVAITSSGFDGPQLTLRLSRSIPTSAAILYRSRVGDVDSLKEILSQRTGSPFDFDNAGYTALMYAVQNLKVEACKMLLSVGADPWQQSPSNRCAYDCAWDAIAYRTGDAASRQEIRTLFPCDDVSDRWGSTFLHKTLLGFAHLDLAEVVRNLSQAEINQVDTFGRTATWWAARRGDTSALSLLLEHGGDGNKMTPGGTRPFDAALTSKEPACYWMFLEPSFNVMIDYKNGRGYTPLHHSCYHGDDVEFVKCLVDRGADINARANDGISPLHFASQEGNTAIADYLISRGANINAKATTGETPLYLAIQGNRHKCIQLLLHHNPDCSLGTIAGETVLHCLAHFADIDTLKLFRDVDLSAVSLDRRVRTAAPSHRSNITGLTAREVADHRKDVSSEWMSLFKEVVLGDMFSELKGCASDSLEENGSFEDALEFQK